VQNIVASADIHSGLNLNAIALGLGLENIECEPGQFPGLVYSLSDPQVVILLFSSSKLVITGGKKPEDVVNAVDRIVTELKSHLIGRSARCSKRLLVVKCPKTWYRIARK